MTSLVPDAARYELARQLDACRSQSRRRGKVARLPATTRDHINRMMDDGIPYKAIIQALGPSGRHLSEQNLSNWRLGGYQDHLRAHILNDRARAQTRSRRRHPPPLRPA